jgi:hypothetical protein
LVSLVDGDERFGGEHAFISFGAEPGTEPGEFRLGCAANAATSPMLVLASEEELGTGRLDVYARVLGLRTANTHEWSAAGYEMELSGFGAMLLLTEFAASSDARGLFLRAEGADAGPWGVPLTGLRALFDSLPCMSSFR